MVILLKKGVTAMPDFFIYLLMLCLGGFGYGALELLWRGYTHWSMVITGGICLCAMYAIDNRTNFKLWQKAAAGAAVITTAEFAVGCVVNLRLGLNVWDYAELPFNLLGQISAVYSLLWLAMSFVCVFITGEIDKNLTKRKLYGGDRP